ITRFLIEEQRRAAPSTGASGSFTALVNDVRLACKRIATLVGKGALAASEGSSSVPGTGEQLALLAEELFMRTSEWGGQLAGMLSKGSRVPYAIPDEYPRGRYLLLFDPLDEPANVDLNAAAGSLFSVLRCPEGVCAPLAEDFLQAGAAQVCAGYALYGP